MERERRCRRPISFLEEERQYLAEFIELHGISGARQEAKMPVSLATLIKIAREFHLKLPKGRRSEMAA